MKRILYVVLQCTWGIGQTLLGLIFFVVHAKKAHHIYKNCIDTRWHFSGGMSLGLFIFTPDDESDWANEVRVHEYGHTFQSLLLGPLYAIVGLISVCWAFLPYFQRLRTQKNMPYTACFVEKWASDLGEKMTGEKAAR